ncbi:metal-dependent hydrolase [Brevibacillus humidisoli]|uniref:metal-dependent hydrolase n=1 Tax=Brevibacillus humidisoli TaxID=2895522 RepID=UPI001E44F5D7|nr:metal-dependent hydrolase [Brevibacillus humidisoli]UFJ42262.1 metal-dependent hydrolase [Brevibacillus humidisoli]
MDTGSHVLFGLTLAGLAHVDPLVAEHPAVAEAVLIGTLIGSNAPDFDAVVRLRGYPAYLRYHRGMTHSLPALVIWPVLITLPLIFGSELYQYGHVLFLWTLAAVVLHVLLDMLNSYGVQSLLPLSKKWVHLDILAIFEPFLFLLHITGLLLWLGTTWEPSLIFVGVYGATALYVAVRAWQHSRLVQQLKRSFSQLKACHVLPSFHWFHWSFVVETETCFITGKIVYGQIKREEIYPKEERTEVIKATMGTDGVRAFLGFAQRIHVTCKEIQDGYEVYWSDVRFCYDRKLPFGADIVLDRNLNVVRDRLGWRKKAWDPPFV